MKRSNRILKSVDEVVDALGGPGTVGARYGIGSNAVSNWKIRSFIPPGWHLRLYLWLKREGHRVDPRVFEIEDEVDGRPFCVRRSRRRSEQRVV